MNIYGITIGVITLIQIGAWHIIVKKSYDIFSAKIWPAYLICGLSALLISLVVSSVIASAGLGVAGVCMLWAILELHQLRQRKESVELCNEPECMHSEKLTEDIND